MNTQEAIDNIWHHVDRPTMDSDTKEKLIKTVELLQRGEKYKSKVKKLEGEYVNREAELFLIIKKNKKYKKMWEGIRKFLNEIQTEKGKIVWTEINVTDILKEMELFEQKYFPKGR